MSVDSQSYQWTEGQATSPQQYPLEQGAGGIIVTKFQNFTVCSTQYNVLKVFVILLLLN